MFRIFTVAVLAMCMFSLGLPHPTQTSSNDGDIFYPIPDQAVVGARSFFDIIGHDPAPPEIGDILDVVFDDYVDFVLTEHDIELPDGDDVWGWVEENPGGALAVGTVSFFAASAIIDEFEIERIPIPIPDYDFGPSVLTIPGLGPSVLTGSIGIDLDVSPTGEILEYGIGFEIQIDY